MKDTCPRLREVVGSFVDVIEDNPGILNGRDMTAYLENLLAFFFSPMSTKLNDNDVIWFLSYVNTLTSVDLFQEVIRVDQDADLVLEMTEEGHHPVKDQPPLLNALSTAMAKQVLGDILTHPQGDERPVPPLSIFHRKVGTQHVNLWDGSDINEGHLNTCVCNSTLTISILPYPCPCPPFLPAALPPSLLSPSPPLPCLLSSPAPSPH